MLFRALSALLVLTVAQSAAWAQLCYKDSDEVNPGQGDPVKWKSTPVPVYINIPSASANLPTPAQVEAAVKAAFSAYSSVNCVDLTFDFKGALSPFVSNGKDGGILVYFGDGTEIPWTFTNNAWFVSMNFNPATVGGIVKAYMAFNAKDFKWSIGAEANKIDVQTAVTQLMPETLGYSVTGGTFQIPIKFNDQTITLTTEQETGVQFLYPKSGCTAPTKPPFCNPAAAGDGGVAADSGTPGDGGVSPDSTVFPPADSGVTKMDGNVVADGGVIRPGDSDGCCRVSHARITDTTALVLIGLGLLVLVGRRRRER
ncbi:MAG: hypothetical protein H6707_07755 [Deltaproteobacteria bacterium]|nr:hypothetical protein [Deltaproteobacteria bacterium]